MNVATRYLALAPLFVSAAVLLAGNGLLQTLVAVRAAIEGFAPATIGLLGTAYFIGFILGCLSVARLVRLAGHIRVFAALAALEAAAILLLLLFIEPFAWSLMRGLMGFCFAGLLTVVESWLNASAEASERGRFLSIYRIVDLSAVTVGQFLLPVIGAEGFAIFTTTAIFFCLSILPICLSPQTSPKAPESPRVDVAGLWRLSPVASVGCITIGATTAAFRTVAPVFAQASGLDIGQVAAFMSAGIIGGAAMQYPFGWLSDRVDRRWTLIAATGGAMLAGLGLTYGEGATWLIVGAFLFGAFALPLYSLAIAHAADYADASEYVALSAGFMLFYGLGASVGPLAASLFMQARGPSVFFLFISAVHGSFLIFAFYRIARRSPLAGWAKKPFVGLLRTSPAYFGLARHARERRIRRED